MIVGIGHFREKSITRPSSDRGTGLGLSKRHYIKGYYTSLVE
jgi:hypothetical protein